MRVVKMIAPVSPGVGMLTAQEFVVYSWWDRLKARLREEAAAAEWREKVEKARNAPCPQLGDYWASTGMRRW